MPTEPGRAAGDPGTVDFLVASLRQGDATSGHTFDLARLLHAGGRRVQIVHNHPNRTLPDDIRPWTRRANFAQYQPHADLTILQYPIWFPLAERLRDVTGAAIFWYHGVTPPALWGKRPGLDMVQTAEIRTELAWHAHLAVAASPFTADELHRHSGYPRERIRVVPLTVDVAALAQPPAASTLAALRRQWQLEGKRVLLYVGRIAGNKRIDLLVQAVAKLNRADLCLLVVGDTQQNDAALLLHAELEALALQRGVGAQVRFTGRVPDVQPYLHLADLVLLPSQHEGFGVPVAEGMAAGKAVIASAGGALPWVLGAQDAEASPGGLLFTPGDADDLARQIGRLLDDPDLVATLVAGGRRRVQAFGADRFAVNVSAVVEEAMALAATGPAPAHQVPRPPLSPYADVVMRDYVVRSGAPWVGRLIEWVRVNSTTHLKEAYLDRILERQVNYNQLLAVQVAELQAELQALRAEVAELRRHSPTGPKEPAP
jgi:glycosyltransferase involved in cell wall biosynthesis